MVNINQPSVHSRDFQAEKKKSHIHRCWTTSEPPKITIHYYITIILDWPWDTRSFDMGWRLRARGKGEMAMLPRVAHTPKRSNNFKQTRFRFRGIPGESPMGARKPSTTVHAQRGSRGKTKTKEEKRREHRGGERSGIQETGKTQEKILGTRALGDIGR
jgi:hypothetical protein